MLRQSIALTNHVCLTIWLVQPKKLTGECGWNNMIRGHPSKTSGRKGGRCVCQCGRPRMRGAPVNQTATNKKLSFGKLYWSPTPHPVHGHSDRNIFSVSNVLRTIRSRRSWTVGCLPNGRCWTGGEPGGGGVQKVIFSHHVFDDWPLS